jgi:hypothetical protein
MEYEDESLGRGTVDQVSALHRKVIRFDITANEVAGMGVFKAEKSGARRTVLRLNLRLQKLKRASREGPRRSKIVAL